MGVSESSEGHPPGAERGTRKGRRRESDHVCISRRLRLAK